jgi:hypothetical protein
VILTKITPNKISPSEEMKENEQLSKKEIKGK